MYKMIAALAATMTLCVSFAHAEEPERDTLYLVTTLRAAPGELAGMIEDLQALATDGYYRDAGRSNPWILRHSQGDHWDLMLVEPVGNYPDFFAGERLEAAGVSETTHKARLGGFDARTSFREELFAWGPSPDALGEGFDTAGLYHVEMFHALPQALGALIEQREMENEYLEATGQVTNWIFVSSLGSDVDVFTIGTHESMQSFASSPELTPAAFEEAATEAGFESRATIGFYLRSLISSHHDTLATPVR
jgi:hypothetical protein